MLLALLALALPTGALGNSINSSDPAFSTGPALVFFFSGGFVNPFRVDAVGSLYRIALSTTLPPSGCVVTCTFSSGTVFVTPAPHPDFVLFSDSVFNGRITITGGTAVIVANLVHVSPARPMGVLFVIDGINTGRQLTGHAIVGVVPEPSTLLTFGTGVLGLVGMIRRKLKRGA